MATSAYYSWVRDGKPITPSRTILETVQRLRADYPRATFSWYADDAHYQADYPQDHTPFSRTGWPQPNPYPYVCATDVMHRPDLGVDCDVLFPYWLDEARAGRMPWLKYLIYKASIYDVRYGWRKQTASGHDNHIHQSHRTDWVNRSIGNWSVTPGGHMSIDDVRKAVHGLLDEAANRSTPTGRQVADDLYAIIRAALVGADLPVVVAPEPLAAALRTALADAQGDVARAVVDEHHRRLAS